MTPNEEAVAKLKELAMTEPLSALVLDTMVEMTVVKDGYNYADYSKIKSALMFRLRSKRKYRPYRRLQLWFLRVSAFLWLPEALELLRDGRLLVSRWEGTNRLYCVAVSLPADDVHRVLNVVDV